VKEEAMSKMLPEKADKNFELKYISFSEREKSSGLPELHVKP